MVLAFIRAAKSISPAVRNAVSARGLATAVGGSAPQKVSISNLEKDKYINYQRIEDNLKIIRKR
ncbi:Aconitate hydratase mitochondrial [Basidiobolus ranarum]|uniref:Aconitate hydratase mitochondrial n=1 Tax=Basidiobolus ranarum TaxID=34480 RepID=A0ABR2VUD0_9FUNG